MSDKGEEKNGDESEDNVWQNNRIGGETKSSLRRNNGEESDENCDRHERQREQQQKQNKGQTRETKAL